MKFASFKKYSPIKLSEIKTINKNQVKYVVITYLYL